MSTTLTRLNIILTLFIRLENVPKETLRCVKAKSVSSSRDNFFIDFFMISQLSLKVWGIKIRSGNLCQGIKLNSNVENTYVPSLYFIGV